MEEDNGTLSSSPYPDVYKSKNNSQVIQQTTEKS